MLQGFLLLEAPTLAGWAACPSLFPSALLGPSLTPGQFLGVRRGSKNSGPGDTGRTSVSCCGMRSTSGHEVAGKLTTPASTGQQDAPVAASGHRGTGETRRKGSGREQELLGMGNPNALEA